jgi:hypothetical protein
MLKRIQSIMRRFRREEKGTVVVEAIIMFQTCLQQFWQRSCSLTPFEISRSI